MLENCHFADGKLRGVAVLDEAKLRRLSPYIYGSVLAGEPVEVSTSLGLIEQPRGNGIIWAIHHRPHHLAVLTVNKEAAASIVNGVGLGLW